MPVTSQLYQWKVPRKRKESTVTIMESVFQKHDYNKPEKKQAKLLDDHDPRPSEYRGTASERLPSLLKNIKGQQLSISLMLDPDCCHKEKSPEDCRIPHIAELKETISAFKQCSEDKLHLTQEIRDTHLYGILLDNIDSPLPS